MAATRNALIVGAGIGGLAAGVALRRAGWNVRIHERATNARELGFALVLAPNAMAALSELGVAEAIGADGVTLRDVELRQPGGRVIHHLPAGGRDPATIAASQTTSFEHPFQAIVAATESDGMRFDELLQRPALLQWGEGRVTLLGDAAHPLLPHTGQGAAQALEDAVALALALSEPMDLAVALRQYESVRSRRTRRLVRIGPQIAAITTTRNPLIRLLRTLAIRLIPESILAGVSRLSSRDPHRALRTKVARTGAAVDGTGGRD